VMFAATGVTDGDMLQGVRFKGNAISTHTFVMRSSTGTVREIKATHREGQKFA
jgi:fructose-1,6-bisphosphatase II / sedoheptulose-1,7-bisphosphatase